MGLRGPKPGTGGRPRGSGTGPRYPERFMVRLPDGGSDRLRERAAAAGEKVGDYVRGLLGEGEVSRPETTSAAPPTACHTQSS